MSNIIYGMIFNNRYLVVVQEPYSTIWKLFRLNKKYFEEISCNQNFIFPFFLLFNLYFTICPAGHKFHIDSIRLYADRLRGENVPLDNLRYSKKPFDSLASHLEALKEKPINLPENCNVFLVPTTCKEFFKWRVWILSRTLHIGHTCKLCSYTRAIHIFMHFKMVAALLI